MSTTPPLLPTLLPTAVAPPSPHGLGPVADDWEAAEVWLRAIAGRGRRNSPETVATYRYHLAKLRWYCETVTRSTPSRWSVQDVDAFNTFLKELPLQAICARAEAGAGFASVGEAGYTPFRKRPSASSRADIQRCVHAMLRAWRELGYIQINPMGLHGAGTVRKVNAKRAIAPDLYEMVLDTMDAQPKSTFEQRQRHVRDRFLFVVLRELGLRSSELVGAVMGDFYPLSDPKSSRTYWILHVRAETSKGATERRIPMTCDAMAALGIYREAFGMTSRPDQNETTALLLSPRTSKNARTSAGNPIRDVQSRRFFQAWRPVGTRHGLYRIVKQRLGDAADFLDTVGDIDRARILRQASTHWLRHTFAKAALLTGQDMRSVAAWLGHRDIGTTMVYTEQDALDLIRAAEQASPGRLAILETEVR